MHVEGNNNVRKFGESKGIIVLAMRLPSSKAVASLDEGRRLLAIANAATLFIAESFLLPIGANVRIGSSPGKTT